MSPDPDVAALAHFAAGLAHRALANGGESTSHLEAAARLAITDDDLRGQVLRSLAFNYAQAGRHSRAERTIDESVDLLSGQERDLSQLQKAFLLLMRGEHLQALPALNIAADSFIASGDEEYLELTLYNRALIHMELGDYDASIEDLTAAYEIGMRLEHHVSAADAALHLSQVLGWRDDVPGAMEWHARSVELRTAAGAENAVADAEHAFVLIQARLMREAEEVLMEALPRVLEGGDNHAIAVQGHLLLAEVLHDRGAYSEAAAQIDLARRAASPAGRYWFDVAAADHRNRVLSGHITPALLASIVSTAADMDANGERYAAAVERFRAVDVALALGDINTATAMCEDANRFVRTGPLWLQIQAWTALAALRRALGNRKGAAAAVRAGFARLDDYRTGIGATDLRIRAAEYGSRLAELGLGLAVDSRSVDRVFSWSERMRTASSRTRPLVAGTELDEALTELRRTWSRVRSADPETLVARRREHQAQERSVTNLVRRSRGLAQQSNLADLASVQAQLGDRVLIEYIEVADSISALVVDRQSAAVVDLGPKPDLTTLVDQLRFAAERIARPTSSPASQAAALVSIDDIAGSIRQVLLDPLEHGSSQERYVIVPTGQLHGVPWGLVLDRPVETAPSGTQWARSRARTTRRAGRTVVSGPDLRHAASEAAAVSALAGTSVVSSVADALGEIRGAELVHFACHALPRVDSPMFSSLRLQDGELTLYDIERLGDAPKAVVLAACDGGSAVMASGAEIMSIAGAFLSLGSRTVVAPVFTVSDEMTAAVMSRFHEELASGLDGAQALLAAGSTSDPLLAFTARSFSCFGAA